ncbi:hypothetical protein OIV83_003901 [Microbotryomycetes sp. JL201]|nr:hypothetical protein OIV83_003901 [Microbotryomycetes sp. JL201]
MGESIAVLGFDDLPHSDFSCSGLSSAYNTVDRDEAKRVLRQAIQLGVTIWDTAPIYGQGDNEKLIGEVLAEEQDRARVFLITKWGVRTTSGFEADGSAEYCHKSIEESIDRLGFTPDAYLLHRIDKNTPIEESARAMDEVRKAGKTKYIGLSEASQVFCRLYCSAETLQRASQVAKIDFIQIEYSPWTLDFEQNGVLALARKLGTIVLAYSPLGRGFLTGKVKPSDLEKTDWRNSYPRAQQDVLEHNMKIVAELEKIAKEKGCETSQLVLAWLMAQGDNIVPIPGTTSAKRLEENFASREVSLSPDDDKRIRKVIEENRPKGTRYNEAGMRTLDA